MLRGHSALQMGRQTVAGFNPFTIKLAPLDLFGGISRIAAEDLPEGAPPLNVLVAVCCFRAQEKGALLAA